MESPPRNKTYGIVGLPRPDDAVSRNDEQHKIPYVEKLPVRREISALASSTDPELRRQWTLFVLALEKFKLKPVNEKLSYFQIAGIHGYPETRWDDAPAPKKDPKGTPKPGAQPFGGYCNHNGLNFPTWHRPYMALFEQCIWDNMKEVIDHWVTTHHLPPNEALLWRSAADTWRMPYWDWARQQSYTEDFAYPQILVQGPVRIFVPDVLKGFYPPSGLYANPFWGFENPEKDDEGNPLPFGKMPPTKRDWNIEDDPVKHDPAPPQDPKDENQWIPWSLASGTSRYGIFVSKTGKRFRGLEGVNNPWEANNNLSTMKKNERWYTIQKYKDEGFKWNPGTLAEAVNRMFSKKYNKTWGEFASTKWIREGHASPCTGYLSLEYIHNNVHNIVGGSDYATGVGHMSDVPVAAFDPIFWLHHTQIDRLLAIWQSLNWDLWWDKKEHGDDNVREDEPTDPLFPFHNKTDGDPVEDVWTAEGCRDWTVFNYQYDDLMVLSQKALCKDGMLDEAKFKTLLAAHINTIYPSPDHLIHDIHNSPKVELPIGLRPPLPGGREGQCEKSAWNDYIINVVYDRYALDGRSYAIRFYLGGPKDVDKTYFDQQNFVGQVYTFGGGVRRSRSSCANCKSQEEQGVLSCAQVPLTIQLLHHAIDGIADHPLKDFGKAEAYLRLHLRWKFVGFGGAEVDEDRFPDTKVSVLRGVGRPRVVDSPLEEAELQTMSISAMQTVEAVPAGGGAAATVMNSAAWAPTDTAAAGDVPQISLPPVYSDYELLPGITDGKRYGLKLGELAASESA